MPSSYNLKKKEKRNTLYLYIGVAFALARTIEAAHGEIPREIGGELIFGHVVKTKFTQSAHTGFSFTMNIYKTICIYPTPFFVQNVLLCLLSL